MHTTMLRLTRRQFIQLTSAGTIAFSIGCKGPIPSIGDVKEYVVELVTLTGEKITEKAGTLAEAFRLLWRKVFPEWDGNVQVDPDNRLKGEFDGTFVLSVVSKREDGREDKITTTLTDPPMFRCSVNEPWKIAPSAYPPDLRPHLER